jgi:hypothetical protein
MVAMMVSNSPRRQPRSSRISPLPEKKRTISYAVVLENYIKIRPYIFAWYGGLIKRR